MKIGTVTKLLTLSVVLFVGCQKNVDQVATEAPQYLTDENHYYEPSKELLASYDALTNPSTLKTRSACNWIELPAGSTDALAQAVTDVCAGGVIYLKSGVHTENKMVTISKSVILIGEKGAVLKVKSSLSSYDTVNMNVALKPALHFLNAPRSAVLDLEIQPIDGDGSTAILFENSNESAAIRCKISKFQSAVMVEKSDRMAIMKNTVVCSSSWQTDPFPFGESIVIINGKSAYISDNEVSNSLFGIWPCDEWGTCERNNTHGNFLGVILCNVPAGIYLLPSGRGVGAKIPTKGCKVRNNKSMENQWGILVIDGANNNILENNDIAKNAAYDIELTTDSYRFGFLTPMAYDNTVDVGSFSTVRVKDCGRNNKVIGGIKIDNAVDPCF
jgi:Periplasmic copper-binding protein (NosD)